MLINLVTEYLFTRFVVYGKAVNTSADAQKEPTLNLIGKFFASKRKLITPNPNRAAILTDLSANVRPGGIVFLGDSITEIFLASEYLPDYRIYNRGIGGDTTAGVLQRLDSHVVALRPSKIFLLIGTNDIGQGQEPAYIVGNIQKIIEELQQKLPETQIYLESILPVNSCLMLSRSNAVIKIINAALQAISGVTYIDLFPSFIDETGNLKGEYSYDGLHLGHQGYLKLREILAPYLAEPSPAKTEEQHT